MKRIAARVLCVLFLLLPMLGLAQQEGTYRLQPEDVILVQIYGDNQVNTELEIGKDGNVSVPFAGIVRAEGKTTTELEQELREIYIRKLKLRDPIVSVVIRRFRIPRASITGMVSRAGVYPFREGETVLSLISQAGGALPDRADLKRAMLRRSNSPEEIPIDLEAMLEFGDTSQNYKLRDGDELIIPEAKDNRIVVWGAVQQPGTFAFTEGMRVADALGLSRGEIRGVSKQSGIKVFRRMKGQPNKFMTIAVNMVAFWDKRQDYTQNIELEKGDIIHIPSTKTPNAAEIGAILNAAFFADRVLASEGFFGFRPFGFVGR